MSYLSHCVKIFNNSFGVAFPSWISSFNSLFKDLKVAGPTVNFCVNEYIKLSLSDKMPFKTIGFIVFSSSSFPSMSLFV
jgi:hypothetical protein